MAHGRSALGLGRVLAVVTPDNEGSIRLLEKLGFRFDRMVRLSDGAPEISLCATER